MTVFKAFLKVLSKNKIMIIIYTGILIGISVASLKTSDTSTNFVAVEPDVIIINEDVNKGVTKGFIDYMNDNCDIIDNIKTEEEIDDSLFYRQADYVIYIPKGFNEDFLSGKNPEIKVKSNGDYQASLAEMMIKRYFKTAENYRDSSFSQEEIIVKTKETINKEAKIEMTTKLDTDVLEKMDFYYNFASYSISAALVYVVCMILNSFREEKIRKRTEISSVNYRKHNRQLLLSNCIFSIVLWFVYVIASSIIIGNSVFDTHGYIFMINSLIFTICSTALAFLIGTLITNKNAIAGIVNVWALGSSFLCGVFVPMDLLPDVVIKAGHLLPTYYYVEANNKISKLENINTDTLKPIITNMGIVLGFMIVFIVLTNIISKKKSKI
ncbi:MAG: ABC transporter permease [Clostridia bacterium]|nr:ABC transporter permease [Clostridia bacterium]